MSGLTLHLHPSKTVLYLSRFLLKLNCCTKTESISLKKHTHTIFPASALSA